MNQHVPIMGIPFPKLTMEQSVELLQDVIDQKEQRLFHVVTGKSGDRDVLPKGCASAPNRR